MALCIFIASHFKGQQKSIKKISEVFKIKEVDLELSCETALGEIKETLQVLTDIYLNNLVFEQKSKVKVRVNQTFIF